MIINTTLCCPEEKKKKMLKIHVIRKSVPASLQQKTMREKSWIEYVQS